MSDGAGPSGTAQEAPASDAAERAAHDRAEEAAPASSAHPADGSPAEDDPHAPLPPIPPGSEGGVFVVVDGESVYIPPDPDFPPPAPGSADAGAASSGPVPVFIPVWEMGPGGPPTPAAARAAVEQAQRELRAAVAQGRVIGLGRARPMVLSKSLKLADAFLAAGFPEPAEALYQHVFEWAGADYGGRSALARGGAEGLARIYRARGEDAKAEWVRAQLFLAPSRRHDMIICEAGWCRSPAVRSAAS